MTGSYTQDIEREEWPEEAAGRILRRLLGLINQSAHGVLRQCKLPDIPTPGDMADAQARWDAGDDVIIKG
jgi:hypothetical protein